MWAKGVIFSLATVATVAGLYYSSCDQEVCKTIIIKEALSGRKGSVVVMAHKDEIFTPWVALAAISAGIVLLPCICYLDPGARGTEASTEDAPESSRERLHNKLTKPVVLGLVLAAAVASLYCTFTDQDLSKQTIITEAMPGRKGGIEVAHTGLVLDRWLVLLAIDIVFIWCWNLHMCLRSGLRRHLRRAKVYRDQGDFSSAVPLCLESRDLLAQVYGKQHPEYADALNDLGVLYLDTGEFGKAEPVLLECRDIRLKALLIAPELKLL